MNMKASLDRMMSSTMSNCREKIHQSLKCMHLVNRVKGLIFGKIHVRLRFGQHPHWLHVSLTVRVIKLLLLCLRC